MKRNRGCYGPRQWWVVSPPPRQYIWYTKDCPSYDHATNQESWIGKLWEAHFSFSVFATNAFPAKIVQCSYPSLAAVIARKTSLPLERATWNLITDYRNIKGTILPSRRSFCTALWSPKHQGETTSNSFHSANLRRKSNKLATSNTFPLGKHSLRQSWSHTIDENIYSCNTGCSSTGTAQVHQLKQKDQRGIRRVAPTLSGRQQNEGTRNRLNIDNSLLFETTRNQKATDEQTIPIVLYKAIKNEDEQSDYLFAQKEASEGMKESLKKELTRW